MEAQAKAPETGSKSHRHIIRVTQAVSYLRQGGTATDVREAYCDLHRSTIGISTVRRILELLYEIDKVSRSGDPKAYWWSAKNVSDDLPAAGNHGASEN